MGLGIFQTKASCCQVIYGCGVETLFPVLPGIVQVEEAEQLKQKIDAFSGVSNEKSGYCPMAIS